MSEVVKEIQGDRTSKQSQHKSPGPEAPLCLSRPGNECPLVLITLRAHTGDMTDSIVLYVFYVARGHSLPVNIRFVLPPPPGDQCAVCTALAGRADFLVCVFPSRRHITFEINLFVVLFNNYRIIKKKQKTPDWPSEFWPMCFLLMQLLTVSLPFEFPTVLRSLDMIIPVTPIWKRFVHTLARTDVRCSPARVEERRVDTLAGICNTPPIGKLADACMFCTCRR